jgi:hypothetical protein
MKNSVKYFEDIIRKEKVCDGISYDYLGNEMRECALLCVEI